MIYCEACPRAYHHDCYIPPLAKPPRGKWYCVNCVSKAPPKKRSVKKPKDTSTLDASAASAAGDGNTTVEGHPEAQPKKEPSERSKSRKKKAKDKDKDKEKDKEKMKEKEKELENSKVAAEPEPPKLENNTHNNTQSSVDATFDDSTAVRPVTPQPLASPLPLQNSHQFPEDETDGPIPSDALIHSTPGNATGANQEFVNLSQASINSDSAMSDIKLDSSLATDNSDSILNTPTLSAKEKAKKERKATKKLMKELAVCKTVLEEMEVSLNITYSPLSYP